MRRVDLANWALRTSPKFATGVKHQFHQGFRPDKRSGNPNQSSPPELLKKGKINWLGHGLRRNWLLKVALRNGKRKESSRQKKISDDRKHYYKWIVCRYDCRCCSWVLRRSLTHQVISVTFYIEREKSDKFCSETLISAWGSFTCRKSTTRDPRLYFPSEGSHTQDFYALKNP